MPFALAPCRAALCRVARGSSLIWCLGFLLWACQSAPAPVTPRGAAEAYARAIEKGRYDEAYALLSSEARADISRGEFERRLRAHPEETARWLEDLRTDSEAALVRATVTGKDGQEIHLVYEKGAWRLDESSVDVYGQRTPRDALRAFVRAYDAKRWDVLIGFVPAAELSDLDQETLRKSWEGELKGEMDRIVEGLRASLERANIEVSAGRAAMIYAGGGTVELVLEAGLWKIEDFQ